MTDDARDTQEIADEYVLGLLDLAEAELVETALEHDAALRAAVAASRDRFLELDMATPPAPVASDLWPRIAARLDRPADPEARPASKTALAPVPPGRWRAAALLASAAALLLAVGLGWSLWTRPEPVVIAVLVDSAGEPLALVEDFGDESARLRPLADLSAPPGQTIQVWTKPSEEIGPVSLGLLPASATVLLSGPPLPTPQENQLYEITLEQQGGSPTGLPTGPILAKGFAKAPR